MEDRFCIREVRQAVAYIRMGETRKKRRENTESSNTLLLYKPEGGKQVFAVLQAEPGKFLQLFPAAELQQIFSRCGPKPDRLISKNTAKPKAYPARPFLLLLFLLPCFAPSFSFAVPSF
jgi:hypothetical protein